MTAKLLWTRVMAGEYQAEAPNGWRYFIDAFSEGCERCNHSHDGWYLTGSPGGITRKLGEFPTFRDAKRGADLHAAGEWGGA
jgi:hypothetical protein